LVTGSAMYLSARLIFISLILSAFSLSGLAQEPASRVAEQSPPNSVRRPNADETFQLNVDERRFSQDNFEVSTAVGTEQDTQGGLNLQIGVGLAAGRIDVLLRNVRGNVRFRGTLDRVLEMINRRAPSRPLAPK
jgi:hypothetical protein